MLLKQSTNRNRVILMIDSSDHVTGKTGLTLTIKASKDGAAFATITPTVTELESGFYNLALTTSHTDTLGDFALHITAAAADPTDLVDQVVVDLPGATVSSVTGSVGSVTGNVGGNVTGSVGSVASGGISASSFAAGAIDAAAIAADAIGSSELAATAITEIQSGLSTLSQADIRTAVGLASANLDTQLSGIQSDTNDIQTRLPAALVSGRIDASVGAMAADVITATAIAADAIGSSELAASAVNEIADQVWEETLADHSGTVGSTAEALGAAGSAGDPWATQLPGAYGAGSAGKIVGDNINATVSSRASQSSVDTIDDFLDTEIAAIKAKTDKLTFDVDNALDANIQKINDTTLTGNGTSGTPWGPV